MTVKGFVERRSPSEGEVSSGLVVVGDDAIRVVSTVRAALETSACGWQVCMGDVGCVFFWGVGGLGGDC
jgi:hypothetical protein